MKGIWVGLKFLRYLKVPFNHTLVIKWVWFMTMFTRCGVKSKLLSKLSNCRRVWGLDLNTTMRNTRVLNSSILGINLLMCDP